ncbi:MAG: serine racemase VanT catalytic subunit [Coprococcus sp.]|nr:serine racemase VanT catalytic subunit [Coprococcus sp.]
MKTKQSLCGLDAFRLAAAFLVIAIHTSPLAGFHGNADFFLTRILARVAVPFFLMITGQFIVADFFDNADHTISRDTSKKLGQNANSSTKLKLKKYLSKICLLYMAAILIYLPIGIYSGLYHFQTAYDGFRMLIFDGTFYHLWYFPACIIGILIVYLLSRFLSLPVIAAISFILYIFGLFGDSYYGLTYDIPAVKEMYDYMFMAFSYTRNGIFFAPVFLVLGAVIGRQVHTDSRLSAIGFCLSFMAMTIEGFMLHIHHMQRHDSMYIMLIPTMYFLYRLLLDVKRRTGNMEYRSSLQSHIGQSVNIRQVTTWIYVIHPAMIIVVRAVGKLLNQTELFVSNSLVHYIAVSLLSLISAYVIAYICRKLMKPKMNRRIHRAFDHTFGKSPTPTNRAWIELDMVALQKNVHFLQSKLPEGSVLMPAVKADAYGHGAVLISRELNRLGINHFCVACADEGVELRRNGVKGEILILGYTHPDAFPILERYKLTQTVIDYAYACQLNNYGRKLHVHIGIDTGMHRLGTRSENIDDIISIFHMRGLIIDGMYTHLSVSDSLFPRAKAFTRKQADCFYETIDRLKASGYKVPKIHLQASYGLLNYPELGGDYARVGIALYGVLSAKEDTDKYANLLLPVLSLKARVSSVRTLQKDESAGYGMAFTAVKETKIATLSIGYADGLPRNLSNGVGSVLINGHKAKIAGRICMDQTIIDVTDIPYVASGDIVTIIGTSGNEMIGVADIAEQTHTITNEVLSRLGSRLVRIVK